MLRYKYRTTRNLALAGAVLAAAGLAGSTPASAVPGDPCPVVVAHKTNPNAAPENTVAGIASVPATGARWVEMDLRDSKSGYSVLMHDETVDRTTNGTGKVAELGLTAMTAMDANQYGPWNGAPPAKVPYAWDYLNAINQYGLNAVLDVKVAPTEFSAKKLLEYMDRWAGMRSRVLYMGGPSTVAAMRAYAGDTLRYSLIEYPPTGTMRTAEWLKAQGVTAYAVPAREITRDKVEYYQHNGIQVWTWTSDTGYDTPATRQAMRDAGVDMLITNMPAVAVAECPPLPAPSQVAPSTLVR
jgi:glycerophosphoryl diester phosphodiesterase